MDNSIHHFTLVALAPLIARRLVIDRSSSSVARRCHGRRVFSFRQWTYVAQSLSTSSISPVHFPGLEIRDDSHVSRILFLL